jgi:biotin carboxylase
MSKPRVMILGASRYYVRYVAAAQELGCEVLLTDRNPQAEAFRYADRHEAVDITDIAGSIAAAERHRVDAVVAVNDFGVQTAAAIADALHLVGIRREVAEHATSKAWMRRIWAQAGVPSANFRIVKTLEEANLAAVEVDQWPLIVKPADSRGGGSRGVSKVNHRGELPGALTFAQSFYEDKSVLIEEFLDGTEHSIDTITYDGQTVILAASDKVKTPAPYRVDKSVIYPTLYEGAALRQIHEVTQAAVRALGITIGAAHVELCMTAHGPKLFEIGARCGGGGTPDPIVPWVTGVEMVKEVIRLALGERPKQLCPLFNRGCVYRFLTPTPGRVKEVQGIDEVKAWKNVLDGEVLVKPGDEIRRVKTGGDRAGFLIAAGETRDDAIALADRAEDAVTFLYERSEAA